MTLTHLQPENRMETFGAALKGLAASYSFAFISFITQPTISKIAGMCAIVASLFTMWAAWKGSKLKATQNIKEAMIVCEQCKHGNRPPECPWNSYHLPVGCPKLDELKDYEED